MSAVRGYIANQTRIPRFVCYSVTIITGRNLWNDCHSSHGHLSGEAWHEKRSIEPMASTHTMETVTSADGTEIAVERAGSGPPLVLAHGNPGEIDSVPDTGHLEEFVGERTGGGVLPDCETRGDDALVERGASYRVSRGTSCGGTTCQVRRLRTEPQSLRFCVGPAPVTLLD